MRIPTPNRRRGAALLIIIGLLALLLIATVSFSILMTVERNAAANYRHTVQARQMLFAGLAKALADIDANVDAQGYPPWTNFTMVVTNNGIVRNVSRVTEIFPSIDTTPATAPASTNFAPCYAKPLSWEAMKYIPKYLHRSLETNQAECLAYQVGGEAVGRFAYVAINVSGLLDANLVGNTNFTRLYGVHAGEIQLANGLPFDVTNSVYFDDARRTDDYRYESLAELGRLNEGIAPAKLSNFETFSYALADLDPTGGPKVCIGDDLSGTPLVDQLRARRKAITNAFVKCGINRAMATYPNRGAEWAYLALIDYVDPDSVPEGTNEVERLARPASENVPMIQNIALWTKYSRVKISTTNYTHTVTNALWVYCSKPYVGTNPATSFQVYAEICITTNSGATNWNALLPADPWITNTGSSIVRFPTNTLLPTSAKSLTLGLPARTITSTNKSLPYITFTAHARARVLDASGSTVLDQIPAASSPDSWTNGMASTKTIKLRIAHTFGLSKTNVDLDISPVPEDSVAWAEALDPTINWDGDSDYGQWIYSESLSDPASLTNLNRVFARLPPYTTTNLFGLTSYGTLDTFNAWDSDAGNPCGGILSAYLMTHSAALDWWNTNSSLSVIDTYSYPIVPDGVTFGGNTNYWDPALMWKRHYVKNGPLESVGELGYLKIGRWMTINLYPHEHATNRLSISRSPLPTVGFHPVLDYFTTRPTNGVTRGLVNVNTRNPDVRAAVFNQMPLNEWTTNRFGIPLGTNHARAFGNWLDMQCGVITNLSSLANFWAGITDLGQANGRLITNITRSPPVCMISTQVLRGTDAQFGEFEREAVIRNTVAFYTMRQQIYTIVVRADAMTYEFGGVAPGAGYTGNPVSNGSVLSSALGIFQVWRDPVPDAEGNHACFVRLCKILSL